MITNNVLFDKGVRILREKLGDIEMERFIALVIREPFDYTKWRRDNLCVDMTAEEISKEAMDLWNSTNND